MLHSNDIILFKNENYININTTHSVFPDIYTESSETSPVISENNKTFSNINISEEESKTQETHEINDRPQLVHRVQEQYNPCVRDWWEFMEYALSLYLTSIHQICIKKLLIVKNQGNGSTQLKKKLNHQRKMKHGNS